MPSYHVDIAGLVAGADAKWVDNLLTRTAIDGVERATHGVARRLSVAAVRHIALTRQLVAGVGMSVAPASRMASALLTSADGCVTVRPGLEIRLDRDSFNRSIDGALAEAVEQTVPARRGRPPVRRDRGA